MAWATCDGCRYLDGGQCKVNPPTFVRADNGDFWVDPEVYRARVACRHYVAIGDNHADRKVFDEAAQTTINAVDRIGSAIERASFRSHPKF